MLSLSLRDEESKWEIFTPVSSGPAEHQPPSKENKGGVRPAQAASFSPHFLPFTVSVVLKSHP